MTQWNFEQLISDACREIDESKDLKTLEALRIRYVGKNGVAAKMFESLAQATAETKPLIGKGANTFRAQVSQALEKKKHVLVQTQAQQKKCMQAVDVTLPGVSPGAGQAHILTQTLEEICAIFECLGFVIFEGPEIETEFHNFTALNIPLDHPSRDAFDTFYLDAKDPDQSDKHLLLRSHTSPGQIRAMQQHKPPLAVVVPGKVYRPDAVDASHSFMFHQVEGLLVDEGVSFADLKGLLHVFCQRFFGETITMRFRPHFFPFTEPSAEVDISCYLCQGKGCSTCGRKGWLEILGCGMVHPKVFQAVQYPQGKYTGLAFGMGVERMAMLKHGISDIRLFFENDLRFLKQF